MSEQTPPPPPAADPRRKKLILGAAIGGGCLLLILLFLVVGGIGLWLFAKHSRADAPVRTPVRVTPPAAPEPLPAQPPPSTPAPAAQSPAPTPSAPPRAVATDPALPPLPLRPQLFVNQKDAKLPAALGTHFVEFLFAYPREWKPDPSQRSAGNVFIQVQHTGSDGSVHEAFSVGTWPAEARTDDRQTLTKLSQTLSDALSKAMHDYHQVSIEPVMAGLYEGMELQFTARNERGLEIWGKFISLRRQDGSQKDGPIISMIASSASPYVKGLADLGVKGELPFLIHTFRWGHDFATTGAALRKASSNAEILFRLLDLDGSGTLTGRELIGGQWLRFDADHDGVVRWDEFAAGMANEAPEAPPTTAAPAPAPDPTPEATPSAPAMEGPPGVYTGRAFNAGQTGIVRLELLAPHPGTGAVAAHFEASQGLYGTGNLAGTLQNGILQLSGPVGYMGAHFDFQIKARFTSRTKLEGSYVLNPLTRSSGVKQQGSVILNLSAAAP